MSKIIEVSYRGEIGFFPTIEQVKDFLKIRIETQEFLDFKNYDGVSNSQIILDSYSTSELIQLKLADDEGNLNKKSSDIRGDMPCKWPIVLFIDDDKVTMDLIVNQSTLLVNDDTSSNETVGDKKYVNQNVFFNRLIRRLIEKNPTTNFDSKNNTKVLLEHRVWIWCKTLCDQGIFNDYSVFDLSPFVQSLSTNQTETGGNFTVSLSPIDGHIKMNIDSKNNAEFSYWHPNKDRYVKFDNNFLFKRLVDYQGIINDITQNGKSYFQQTNLNGLRYDKTEQDGEITAYIHNEVFFKNLISENDVVFISFDSKDATGIKFDVESQRNQSGIFEAVPVVKERQERERRTGSEIDVVDDFFINCDEIVRCGWDMIGLIDTNGLNLNYEDTNQEVSVSGRDLMKLLLEDGSYFFAKSYSSEENESVFNNVNLTNSGDGNNTTNKRVKGTNPKGINRLMTTGIIDMLYNQDARNVQFVMNLLLSRLANIEICPSEVFKAYGSEITEFLVPSFEYTEDLDDSIKTKNEDGD